MLIPDGMWKKILIISFWSLLGIATCTLLIAAMQKKDEKTCTDINIQINGAHNHVFVDRKDIMKVMQVNGAEKGKPVASIDLKNIEEVISKNAWVKNAELFFDNKQVLHVTVNESEPIARIFSLQGNSFYIDSSCKRLPLSNTLSAHVPMFTSFPSDRKVLSKPDSAVLQDIKKIALHIQKDSFWMAQIAQVDVTQQRTYEIIPLLGNQLIKIGDAENLDEKFAKLMGFYKQVWSKSGFEKYETVDVQYKGQIVATKRGEKIVNADTIKAMMQMANALQQMKDVMNDTSFAAPIVKPATAVKQDSAKQTVIKVNEVKKESLQKKAEKPAANKKQPKAVMKKTGN